MIKLAEEAQWRCKGGVYSVLEASEYQWQHLDWECPVCCERLHLVYPADGVFRPAPCGCEAWVSTDPELDS